MQLKLTFHLQKYYHFTLFGIIKQLKTIQGHESIRFKFICKDHQLTIRFTPEPDFHTTTCNADTVWAFSV